MTCLDRGWVAAVQRCAAVAFFVASTVPAQSIDLAFERAVAAAQASPILPADIVERANDACDTARCFAETLAADLPHQARLEPVTHPDTDTIRWVTTRPSVTAKHDGDLIKLKLTHFGRKSVAELREALTGAGRRLLVDLRGNPGGDFERMLQIAGLLLGPRRDAIEINHGNHIERRSLKGPSKPSWRITRIRTDEDTASAALLLARLVDTHSDAEVTGPPIHAERPIFLKRRIAIDHDWRLVLPVAEVRVAAD